MEAKDTVSEGKVASWVGGEGNLKVRDMLVANMQAEISFKAGRDSMLKEVKEWIAENRFGLTAMDNYRDFGVNAKSWQAFLKSLEGGKK